MKNTKKIIIESLACIWHRACYARVRVLCTWKAIPAQALGRTLLGFSLLGLILGFTVLANLTEWRKIQSSDQQTQRKRIMKQANQIANVATQMDTDEGDRPCAWSARYALQKAKVFGLSAKFIADSNVGESVTSITPNEAYLMRDGSVYEVTYSGANWYESLEEAAEQRGYIRRALAA